MLENTIRLQKRIKDVVDMSGVSEEDVINEMIYEREKEIRELIKEKQWLQFYYNNKAKTDKICEAG